MDSAYLPFCGSVIFVFFFIFLFFLWKVPNFKRRQSSSPRYDSIVVRTCVRVILSKHRRAKSHYRWVEQRREFTYHWATLWGRLEVLLKARENSFLRKEGKRGSQLSPGALTGSGLLDSCELFFQKSEKKVLSDNENCSAYKKSA